MPGSIVEVISCVSVRGTCTVAVLAMMVSAVVDFSYNT